MLVPLFFISVDFAVQYSNHEELAYSSCCRWVMIARKRAVMMTRMMMRTVMMMRMFLAPGVWAVSSHNHIWLIELICNQPPWCFCWDDGLEQRCRAVFDDLDLFFILKSEFGFGSNSENVNSFGISLETLMKGSKNVKFATLKELPV